MVFHTARPYVVVNARGTRAARSALFMRPMYSCVVTID
jgi:hypothetical protein